LRERAPAARERHKLTIRTGKNAGEHPSVASLYRALVSDCDQVEGNADFTARQTGA